LSALSIFLLFIAFFWRFFVAMAKNGKKLANFFEL
jgi:hypothetical protein